MCRLRQSDVAKQRISAHFSEIEMKHGILLHLFGWPSLFCEGGLKGENPPGEITKGDG
jgi:hypothetical protein